jgi:hypothetical protein
MRANRIAVATLAAVGTFVLGGVVGIGQQAPAPGSNPAQGSQPTVAAPLPLGYVGEAIYPSFEGWGPAKNGQNYILIGYYNRNKDQTIDIPIGPNNHIEPGGPDLLQPTHFEPGRAWGVFALPVPKEFGTKKYTWTLVANGKSAVIQYWINPPYWVDFYRNAAKGNTPPVIKFSENGPELTGPPLGVALNLTATVNQPLTLKLWAKDKPNTYDPEEGLPPELKSRGRGRGRGNTTGNNDPNTPAAVAGATPDANGAGNPPAARGRGGRGDAAQNWDFSAATGRPNPSIGRGGGGGRGRGTGPQPDVTVTWKVHRGSAPVKFADDVIRLFNGGDTDKVMEATTTATFSQPGDYMLRAQVNDDSGDGGAGEQCCWTNALVKVTVK